VRSPLKVMMVFIFDRNEQTH